MDVLARPGAPTSGAKLCALDDLKDPQTRVFEFGAGEARFAMFVVRAGDTVKAYLNVCPHAGHPLDFPEHQILGNNDTVLRCSSHGAQFDIASGDCLAGPCIGKALTEVPIYIAGGMIMVGVDGQ